MCCASILWGQVRICVARLDALRGTDICMEQQLRIWIKERFSMRRAGQAYCDRREKNGGMSKVLIINPILYTAETNHIPRVNSIKDTMIYALCMGFVQGGHKVTLLAAEDYRPLQEEEYPFTVIFRKTAGHRIFQPRCFPYMPGLRNYLRRHREFDLILSSEAFATWTYTAVRMRPDRTIVWQELAAHNNMLHRIPSKFWYNIVARFFMKKAVVVPRSEAAAAFIGQFMKRVSKTVIDHGVDMGKLDRILQPEEGPGAPEQSVAARPPFSEKKRQFVVVSQLIERKRIHRILEVFAELIARGYGDYRLYLIGRGEREGALRALAEKLALQEKVVFCGQMTHSQLLPVVAASKAMLVYTGKDNNMVSIVESIAVGTPVVTTAVPYNAAYIRREQLGIAEDEWTVEALVKIIKDNEFYRQNCLRYRTKLSTKFCAEQFFRVLEEERDSGTEKPERPKAE